MDTFMSNDKSLGLNNLFETTNCAFYLLAFFSVVVDYKQNAPFPLYILVFVMGPPHGLIYIGEDEFITWRWNALYNRRYYWHALLNALVLAAWCSEIHISLIEEQREENIFPIEAVRDWIARIEFAGSVCFLCWCACVCLYSCFSLAL